MTAITDAGWRFENPAAHIPGMIESSVARQPKGVPSGGQFAAATHAESSLSLGASASAVVMSVPSNPQWFRLVYEDRPAHEERRSYARTALRESLDGDMFNVVHDEDEAQGILAEAERDDSVDHATRKIRDSDTPAHQFGAAMARELDTIRARRLAVESHYVPAAADTLDAAAAHLGDSAQDYQEALRDIFPHADEQWHAQMLKNHQSQPEQWQRRELSKMAVLNERNAALKAARPEVDEAENANFTSHPVTPLESRIDALIAHRGDPTEDANIRYLSHDAGDGYGTVFIKEFAEQRLRAWRHTPIRHTGKTES